MVNPQTAADPGVIALYQRLSLLEGLLPRLIYLENMAATSQMGSPVAPSPNGSASSHLPTPALPPQQPPLAGPSRSSVPFVKIEEGLEDERASPILSDTEDGASRAAASDLTPQRRSTSRTWRWASRARRRALEAVRCERRIAR